MLSKVSLRNLARFTCKPSTQNAVQRTHQQFLCQFKSAQVANLTQSYVNFFTSNQKASFTTIAQPKPQLDLGAMVNDVQNQSWEEIYKLLPIVASRRSFEYNSKNFKQFFGNVETKFIREDTSLISNDLLVELGYIYGMNRLGSKGFWERLISKVKNNIGEIELHQIARFIYGATCVATVAPGFLEELENVIQEHRVPITTALCGYLMPSILRNMKRIQAEAIKNQKSENRPSSMRAKLDKLPLWNNLKDHAVAQIEEARVVELIEIALALTAVRYQNDGFWTSVQQRALELKDEMDETQIASLVEVFGNMKKGGPNFWQEMESYTLENFERLQIKTLTEILNGFANSGEGSFRMWNELSHYLLNADLSVSELAKTVNSLGNNETLSDNKWEDIETKVLKMMPEFKIINILDIIVGFGKSKKGSPKLWSSIEEKILSLEVSRSLQVMLYINLKSANKLSPALATHFQAVAPKIEKALEKVRKMKQARIKPKKQI